MHQPVVELTEAHHVAEPGLAALAAVHDVVRVERTGVVAAGELAGAVTEFQPPALCARRRGVLLDGDRPDRGVGHRGDGAVAGEALDDLGGDRSRVFEGSGVGVEMDDDLGACADLVVTADQSDTGVRSGLVGGNSRLDLRDGL